MTDAVECSPIEACKNCGSFEHYSCRKDDNGMFSIMGHARFFGHIIGTCPECNSAIGSAIGKCDSHWCRAKDLPWWRLDQHGWPIERITNRPAPYFWLRVLAQNIRKVTG